MCLPPPRLKSVLDLLPASLEPGDPFPDLMELSTRIAHLRQQHLVINVEKWIDQNSVWLRRGGLYLFSGQHRSPSDDQQTLYFYSSHEDDETRPRKFKNTCITQINLLTDLLETHCTVDLLEFVEVFVNDLNHVRWSPESTYDVLVRHLDNAVADPRFWLGRHIAARQANLLESRTAKADGEFVPSRL